MSAAHPLPTNSSSSTGRNLRGVGIESTALSAVSHEKTGCYHGDYAAHGPSVYGHSPNDRARKIVKCHGTHEYTEGAAMAWWKRGGNGAKGETGADPSLPLIRLDGVTKIFKGDADEETRALDALTLDIDRGEYISVSGPSGCGKSTLLSILALLDTP